MKAQQLIMLMLLVFGLISARNMQINNKNEGGNMSTIQANMEVIKTLYEQVLNQRNFTLLHNLIDSSYIGPRGITGAAGFEAPIQPLLVAIPDANWEIEEMIAEADKVMVKQKVTGMHKGPFLHFSPTSNIITNEGIAVYQLDQGKIISSSILTDRFGFLQQIDVLPQDLSLLSNRKVNDEAVQFIDKFLVPKNAKQEFLTKTNINRKFIKTLPGFIEDTAYERTDDEGNLIFITIAVWENQQALDQAKEAVQSAYKKEGFNPAEMMNRLNITMERGIFQKVAQ